MKTMYYHTDNILVNNIEYYQSTISYIQEKNKTVLWHNIGNIILAWNTILYKESWTNTQWNVDANSEWTKWITKIWYLEKVNDSTYSVLFTDFWKIKSAPIYKNKNTGVTRCSQTAQENWNKFWLKLPSWNAKKGVEATPIDSRFLKTEKEENGTMVD